MSGVQGAVERDRNRTRNATQRRLKARLRTGALAAGAALTLAACGGGGGVAVGTPAASSASAGTPAASASYTAVAMAGELVSYAIDTANLTYRYTIVDSMYGLAGNTGTGTLARNGDGTYSLSGVPDARIAMLPNGLMLGAIREPINGAVRTVPIMGVTNPISTLADGAATYNFVQRSCLAAVCVSAHGTFRINADGTWNSCPAGDLATGCTGASSTGTLNALGAGRWQVLHGGADIGTAILFGSGGQNVLLLDLTDVRPAGFGVGMLVGASQQSMDAARTDGSWFAASSAGEWGAFTASGGSLAHTMRNGMRTGGTGTFAPNAPWKGMGRAATGYGFLAGNGVYVYQGTGGYAEIGVKLD